MFTQPTQTQPTQQSPVTQTPESVDELHLCRLLCTSGQYQFFDLGLHNGKKEWVLGRNIDCDILVNSSTRFLNRHCKLWYNSTSGALWIQDTSTNGTFLNNNRLVKGSNYILNQGDEISIGNGVPLDIVKFMVVFSDKFNPVRFLNKSDGAVTDKGIYKDYIIKNETIGQGAFATVKKVIERATGDSYAVKIINRRKALNTGGGMVAVERELSILRKLDHPNIVYLKAFYEDLDNYYLVMEFVPGGDLMDFVAANGAIGEEATQVITKQILRGINYVHKKGISHRDLKPDNILIMQDDPILVKITDFGLAKISDNSTFMKTFCGTLAYVAPEVITGKFGSSQQPPQSQMSQVNDDLYSALVDIWSLGCLVYVLLTSHLPFNGKTQAQMFQKIKKGEFHDSPLSSYNVSPSGIDFLRHCLEVDPRKRMNAEQALKHEWLLNIDDGMDDISDSPQPSSNSKISLSQSQSQQLRKVDNGLPVTASMSKVDEDIMMRPLDRKVNQKVNEFKVPKRVVPLPQSQPPTKPTAAKPEEQLAFKSMKLNDSIPKDTFIVLTPSKKSMLQDPIYIRQGINPYAIGRNETCDTFVNDDRMSKIHCLINKKRHPVMKLSIYESPAHCLDDIWLLDCSTNSCYVNGVILGKGKKVQLFQGDRIDFFRDTNTHQCMSFIVDIVDTTGLFNEGKRTKQNEIISVLTQDTNDTRLRPSTVVEQVSSARSIGNGGTLNSSLRQKRKAYELENGDKLATKRADLKSDQPRPDGVWFG